MDTTTLHSVTEELAALLSEVTQGDLGNRTPYESMDVGDLYLHVIAQNIAVATAIASKDVPRTRRTDPADRAALGASLDIYGGGLEVEYRRTAEPVKNAFASVTAGDRPCQTAGPYEDTDVAALYDMHVSNTVIHTWDLGQALGLPYQPPPDVAWQVLWTTLSRPAGTQDINQALLHSSDVFGCALTLSGRAP